MDQDNPGRIPSWTECIETTGAGGHACSYQFGCKGNMNQMNTYHIRLRGQMDVNDLNPMSPHQLTVIDMAPSSTLIRISTDQSGLLGMLVRLHNLGLTFLSVLQAEEIVLEKAHEC